MRGSAAGLMGRGKLLGLVSWPPGTFSIAWLVLSNCRLSLRGIWMRRAARCQWVMVSCCVTLGVL